MLSSLRGSNTREVRQDRASFLLTILPCWSWESAVLEDSQDNSEQTPRPGYRVEFIAT